MYVPAMSPQSCPTSCDPIDCDLPGSSVYGFFRQEYWSGLPCPPPGYLSNVGIELEALKPLALAILVNSELMKITAEIIASNYLM